MKDFKGYGLKTGEKGPTRPRDGFKRKYDLDEGYKQYLDEFERRMAGKETGPFAGIGKAMAFIIIAAVIAICVLGFMSEARADVSVTSDKGVVVTAYSETLNAIEGGFIFTYVGINDGVQNQHYKTVYDCSGHFFNMTVDGENFNKSGATYAAPETTIRHVLDGACTESSQSSETGVSEIIKVGVRQ
jgi:hypothetical protein